MKLIATLLIIAVCSISHLSSLKAEYIDIDESTHHGWHIGAAGVFHTFVYDRDDNDDESPALGLGGGISVWGGYRIKGRWEFHVNLDTAAVQEKRESSTFDNKSPDFLLGLSFEPIFFLRGNAKKWDPYIVLPEIGFIHLFRNDTTGFTFVFPGFGMQVHLTDRLNLYWELKLRWGIMISNRGEGVITGWEIPVGVSYRF
jgi:hypothetical protein